MAELAAEAALPAEAGVYGSTFYTMTGGFEVIGLYWQFLDLVWIILITIVYLI